ncbi:MAG: DNA-directed RNA polymerase subunit P [Thermoplasmata archaeon]|nr:DNA-directed RNA polymerase subunit P [Thermoplasmata archaeon]
MYRCIKCGAPISGTIHVMGFQCEKCGSKIFYKERGSSKKVLKAE